MTKKNNLELITENLAALTVAVETQNDIILCLLHKLDVKDVPEWRGKKELEEEMEPKIKACIESVRSLYGQLEADKS